MIYEGNSKNNYGEVDFDGIRCWEELNPIDFSRQRRMDQLRILELRGRMDKTEIN
jgi:hypothetical protein